MHRVAAHATTRDVTIATGDIAGTDPALPGAQGDAVRAWKSIVAEGDIQFAPIRIPEEAPPQPNWLTDFLEWLVRALKPVAEALGMSWPVLQWILLGILALAVLWLLWRLIEPIARIRREAQRKPGQEASAQWAPDRGEALALLEDADRLAAEGLYDEATHLLLRRSIGQIAQARPGWLEPSNTAREIARLTALPEQARKAFAIIADRVERSLFALRRLEAADWQAARTAYADFALADLRESGRA